MGIIPVPSAAREHKTAGSSVLSGGRVVRGTGV